MIYERLCNISPKIIPISRKTNETDNRELARAVRFLKPMMTLTIKGVIAAAYLSATIILLLSMTLLLFFGVNLFITAPLAIMASLVTFYIVISYPVSMMNSYKLGLSEEADLVFEQFILVFQTGGTIFDAIEMIAQSDHPYLSNAFGQILGRIADGIPPETCLMDFC